jgi:4-hydroxybutyryl-CoA dehydratase/vinylacetyl-CoA-Delta-isomerase
MRSSEQFLNSLNDGRRVYYRGELVGDIVHHPVLCITARHAAKLYDYHDRGIAVDGLG